jgi:DNA-binding response OmpR family regulator
MSIATLPTHAPVTLAVKLSLPGEASLQPETRQLLQTLRELAERSNEVTIQALSELATAPEATEQSEHEPVRILPDSRDAYRGAAPLSLTRVEFDLLLFLAENPRRAFTRPQLLAAVWGHTHASGRTVDVHIRRLRAKIGEELPLITTVYGIGYRLHDRAPIVVERR